VKRTVPYPGIIAPEETEGWPPGRSNIDPPHKPAVIPPSGGGGFADEGIVGNPRGTEPHSGTSAFFLFLFPVVTGRQGLAASSTPHPGRLISSQTAADNLRSVGVRVVSLAFREGISHFEFGLGIAPVPNRHRQLSERTSLRGAHHYTVCIPHPRSLMRDRQLGVGSFQGPSRSAVLDTARWLLSSAAH